MPGMASETVCGGQSRQRHVMLSESHDVDVRMVLQSRRDEPGRYILIRYEGTYTQSSALTSMLKRSVVIITSSVGLSVCLSVTCLYCDETVRYGASRSSSSS